VLWQLMAGHLNRAGFGIVLVGGAVISVYTDSAYRSGNLDFVCEEHYREPLDACLAELGVHQQGSHCVHPNGHTCLLHSPLVPWETAMTSTSSQAPE
jgi:hypothetical protein